MFDTKLCLIIDSFHRPLRIANFKDAITLIFGRPDITEVLESYEEVARSPSTIIPLPCVIKITATASINRFKIGFKTLTPSKKNIWLRDGGLCMYCNKELTLAQATLDHLLPKSRGGATVSDNLVLSCADCNQEKSNKHPKNFKPVKRISKALNYNAYIKSGVLKFKFPEVWLKYIAS